MQSRLLSDGYERKDVRNMTIEKIPIIFTIVFLQFLIIGLLCVYIASLLHCNRTLKTSIAQSLR